MRPWRTSCAPVSTLATDNARKDRENSVSKKDKKATDEPMSPMAEALGQSADEETVEKYTASLSAEQQLVNSTAPALESSPEETATGYFDSLSAEQQLVNSTAPALESSPRQRDDDYMHRNFQQYASGSQEQVDAIADRVVEQLKPFIADAFDEAIARAFADNQED